MGDGYSATPPFLTIFAAKEASHRRQAGDSYFIVLQQESVKCVTALQRAYKTRIPLHTRH